MVQHSVVKYNFKMQADSQNQKNATELPPYVKLTPPSQPELPRPEQQQKVKAFVKTYKV